MIAIDKTTSLSDDQHLLLGLVDGSALRAHLGCTERTATALDCTLCSTRVKLALALDRLVPTLQ